MRTAELLELVDSVDGWLAGDEALALHHAAAAIASPDPVAVEIGSWKGRSTVAIASAFRDRGAGTVYAVDPHCGARPHRLTGEDDTQAAFEANIARAGLTGHVQLLRMLSADARPLVTRPIDLVFIDGSHLYEDVLRDIELWTRDLAAGATVALHDVIFFDGVNRAVRERVLRRGSLRMPRLVDDTLLLDHAPGRWSLADEARALRMRWRLRRPRAWRWARAARRRFRRSTA